MLTVLQSGQWTERGKRSVEIEGADHGMELSFHLEDGRRRRVRASKSIPMARPGW
ncbi:MAG TPA: hypothetical protein VK943_05815 [Arenibaculum sp.]|nr:hypothetical protein [Arenibaculum sp.]